MRDAESIPAAIALLLCLLAAPPVAAEPIPIGNGRQTIDLNGTRLTISPTGRPAPIRRCYWSFTASPAMPPNTATTPARSPSAIAC